MSDGSFLSTDFKLVSAAIISSAGVSIAIDSIIKELNLYEDIFSNVVSGDMTLVDATNITSRMHMHGNEYFFVTFQTLERPAYSKVFRIYKISDLRHNTTNSYSYKVHFCTEEFFISHQVRLSKSYRESLVSDIVRDILLSSMSVNPVKIADIEQTIIPQNLIVPNMNALEAINWLSSFSINSNKSSGFVFYENVAGFNFVSLEKMFSANPYKTIEVNPKNTNEEFNLPTKNRDRIDSINFDQLFDSLGTLSTGGYSSSMLKLDLMHQSHEYSRLDSSGVVKLNPFPQNNDSTNRLNQSLNEGASFVRYFNTFQGNMVPMWMLQRAAQFSALNNQKIQIQVPGDSGLKCGDVIMLDVPELVPSSNPDTIDQDTYKSGKYLVVANRHRIFENKYVNIIQLCKDSYMIDLPQAVATNSFVMAKKA